MAASGRAKKPRARALGQSNVRAKDSVREAFIDALSVTASITKACEQSGLPRSSAYDLRAEDPEFAAAWDKALDLGTDALEDEAVRRAMQGTDKPVYQGGELVGYIKEYSDTMMSLLLKGRRPEKFRERLSAELSGNLTVNLAERLETMRARRGSS